MPSAPRAGVPTLVLVHGAGHTAAVWSDVQGALRSPSLAVDLPGRRAVPGALATATVAEAAAAIVAQVEARLTGDADVVLVGHSVAGTVLPSVAALLGPRVRHLVFVAGIAAPEGVAPIEVFLPGQRDRVTASLAELAHRHGGARLEAIDVKDASTIDSLNYSIRPMRWHGLPTALPRTWVRCRRDPIQTPEMQASFATHAGAQTVVDIDSGHTPAIDAPVALAEILDRVATGGPSRGRSPGPASP